MESRSVESREGAEGLGWEWCSVRLTWHESRAVEWRPVRGEPRLWCLRDRHRIGAVPESGRGSLAWGGRARPVQRPVDPRLRAATAGPGPLKGPERPTLWPAFRRPAVPVAFG